MIFKTPNDTTYLSLQNNNTLLKTIPTYLTIDYYYIKDRLPFKVKAFSNEDIAINPSVLVNLSRTEEEIPSFGYTVFNEKDNWSCIDFRPYVSSNKDTLKLEIRNENEFNLQMNKYILSNLWYIGKQKELKDLKFAHMVFCSWISDNLTKRFGLDLNDGFRLKVLGLLYYYSLFIDKLDKEELDKLYVKFKNEFMLNEDVLIDVYEKAGDLTNIESFCKACYSVTDNIRLKGFNVAILNTIIANSWFGVNSKENVLVALEHPATWISIVYASLNNRSFNKSVISQISIKLDKKGKGEEFSKSVEDIVNNYLVKEN